MNREDVKEFIKEVLGPNTPVKDDGDWVSLQCPYAPFTHPKGKDNRPSAGISVNDSGHSIFNCFTCHKKGPLHWFLGDLGSFTGEYHDELAESIEHGEFFAGGVPEWGKKATAEAAAPLTPLDMNVYLDLYESAAGHPYLRQRGISDDTARLMQLMIDPEDSEGEERILFPVFGIDKQLYGFSGRAVDSRARLKVRDYHGLQKRRLLLGSQLILPEDSYIILVEGLMDQARMVEFDQPGLAIMSSTLTDFQVEIVKDIGKPVYFFHDDDEPGRDARDKAGDKLCDHLPFMTVKYPRECTVRDSETGEMRPPEDPAELHRAQVEKMLKTARLL